MGCFSRDLVRICTFFAKKWVKTCKKWNLCVFIQGMISKIYFIRSPKTTPSFGFLRSLAIVTNSKTIQVQSKWQPPLVNHLELKGKISLGDKVQRSPLGWNARNVRKY